jgi:hypothetical protein
MRASAAKSSSDACWHFHPNRPTRRTWVSVPSGAMAVVANTLVAVPRTEGSWASRIARSVASATASTYPRPNSDVDRRLVVKNPSGTRCWQAGSTANCLTNVPPAGATNAPVGSSLPARSSNRDRPPPAAGFRWQLLQLVPLKVGPSPGSSSPVSLASWLKSSRLASNSVWSVNPLVTSLKLAGASAGAGGGSAAGRAARARNGTAKNRDRSIGFTLTAIP